MLLYLLSLLDLDLSRRPHGFPAAPGQKGWLLFATVHGQPFDGSQGLFQAQN